jgi:hypothetical protein
MDDLGHWTTTLTVPESAYGFIYVITNLETNRKYIGKKQMVSKRTRPPLKGKKRKRIEFVESDWKTYVSSSNELVNDIQKIGKENFKFEILEQFNSREELVQAEIGLITEQDLKNPNYLNLKSGGSGGFNAATATARTGGVGRIGLVIIEY